MTADGRYQISSMYRLEATGLADSAAVQDDLCTTEELWAATGRFAQWLDRTGYESYDPYDIWGTRYGRLARRLYYRKHPLGILLTAPFVAMEFVAPGLRRFITRKQRYATADAQLILAFLNLHEATQAAAQLRPEIDPGRAPSPSWLERAKRLADELLLQSVPGYSGYCWGYPFDWQNVKGLMPKGTPHITATPYGYEAFARLFDSTGETKYLEIARSIAAFVYGDLRDTPTGPGAAASSYTPTDDGKVVNASAYRAFVLADAARRFDNPAYLHRCWENVRFILQSQNPDGSWLYAIDYPPEAFIDHFHTCFVLKNLYKLNLCLGDADVERALYRGYAWYRQNLFDEHGDPKSFAIAPRLQIVRCEMYNFAEAITLGTLLRHDIPEAFAHSQVLAARLMRRYQLKAGHWVTRVYFGGIKHTVPFLRWPQSQLFLAVTSLLRSMIIDHA